MTIRTKKESLNGEDHLDNSSDDVSSDGGDDGYDEREHAAKVPRPAPTPSSYLTVIDRQLQMHPTIT
jgi:hypothetical protein